MTVVIPTKNEATNITRCIDSIIAQHNSEGIHIMVADANSTDGTQEIVQELARTRAYHAWIELIPGGSPSKGRNLGLKKCKTQTIVFIDADVELSHSHMLYETCHLLLGKYHLIAAPLATRSGYPSNIAYWAFNMGAKLIARKHPFAVGSFFATRTYNINLLGGFNETLIHSEDWELSQKYPVKKFKRLTYPVIVDDRRFKKFGYFNMLKTMFFSYTRGLEYMAKDNGYWCS